ncbi:transposase [Candidatus Daviesbacteria bacterium]|nr:transposase [Candidatus Daviesbacteria bacterium]
MDRFAKSVSLAYFKVQKKVIIPEKWILLRRLGKDQLTLAAQLRLEWIIFYHTVSRENASHTASHFGISRKTLHKWLDRFNETNLRFLEEQSKRPIKLRGWMVTFKEEARILELRKKNMELGKRKLKRIYFREYGENISTWKIERVIRTHKLYPDLKEHEYLVEKKAQSKPTLRIHEIKETVSQINQFGFLWHIDAIIIWWYGQRRVIFTAIEHLSKIAFARVYTTNSSGFAEDFLKRLMYLAEGRVNLMHQDNGSEFKGSFERACETLNILQVYSRPYTPKDNPALERFNSTV